MEGDLREGVGRWVRGVKGNGDESGDIGVELERLLWDDQQRLDRG